MKKECLDRPGYVRAVLTSYSDLPDTPSLCRPPDRALSKQFFDRQIPLCTRPPGSPAGHRSPTPTPSHGPTADPYSIPLLLSPRH